MREQMNVRVPKMTQDQVDALCLWLGLTKTQLVIVAIERMVRDMDAGKTSAVAARGILADVETAEETYSG